MSLTYIRTRRGTKTDPCGNPSLVSIKLNSSVNASSNYSPYEVVYGRRPHFPLKNMMRNAMFKGLPSSIHAYLVEFSHRLQTIRDAVKHNIEQAQKLMLEKANQESHEVEFKIGDYEYIAITPTGQGRKLKPIYAGPYTINQLVSDHMIKLRDPSGKKEIC